MNRETAVVIANYNGYSDTVACVRSLMNSSYRDFFVVIVDDCSRDQEKVENISSEFDDDWLEIITIKTEENRGFAGANNCGIKEALKYEPSYVILLNNDTVIDEDAFKFITDSCNDRTVTGGRIKYMDNPEIIWSAGGEIDSTIMIPRNTGMGETDGENYKKKRECDFLSFCFVCIPAEAFNDVGYLDESYYMYSEDVDYCYRLKEHGYSMCYEPDAVIYHKAGGSGVGNSIKGTYYGIRNECIIREKYIPSGEKMNKKLYGQVSRERFLRKILHKANNDNEIYYRAMKAYYSGETGKSDNPCLKQNK